MSEPLMTVIALAIVVGATVLIGIVAVKVLTRGWGWWRFDD
jgi:hypothetical protein